MPGSISPWSHSCSLSCKCHLLSGLHLHSSCSSSCGPPSSLFQLTVAAVGAPDSACLLATNHCGPHPLCSYAHSSQLSAYCMVVYTIILSVGWSRILSQLTQAAISGWHCDASL